jgi:hypothetical protein
MSFEFSPTNAVNLPFAPPLSSTACSRATRANGTAIHSAQTAARRVLLHCLATRVDLDAKLPAISALPVES